MSVSAHGERRRLWLKAAALGARRSDQAPDRYATHEGAPWTFEMLAATPDWLLWSAERLAAFARLVGAVAVSRAWGATIDGEPLQRAARVLGADLLDEVLALAGDNAPTLPSHPAECGDAIELARYGQTLLLAAISDRGALVEGLASALEWGVERVDPAAARVAVRTALRLASGREEVRS